MITTTLPIHARTWARDGFYETVTSIGIRKGLLFRLHVTWNYDAEAVVYFFGKWISGVPVPDETITCDPEFWDVMAKAYLDGTPGPDPEEWS